MTVQGRTWPDLRSELVEAFGAFPWRRDEQAIRGAFERFPVAVRRSAGMVVERHRLGKVRDGWRILALEVAGPASSSSTSAGAPDETPEVELLARRLQRWVDHEGRHYPQPDFLEELERKTAGVVDPSLAARLLERWHALQADGTA